MREQEVLLEEILTKQIWGADRRNDTSDIWRKEKDGKDIQREEEKEGNYISRIFDDTSLAQIGDDLQNCFCALLNRLKNIIFCLSIKDKKKTFAKQLVFSLL